MNDPFAEERSKLGQIDTGFNITGVSRVSTSDPFATERLKLSQVDPSIFTNIKSPSNLINAEKLQKEDNGSYNGYCQKFVEDTTYGTSGIFPSAVDAWNSISDKVEGLQGVKSGDLVYFTPDQSNEYNGHVGIYKGNGKFKSATDAGIADYSLEDWTKSTGQKVLGYVPVQ
jgi:hypothetical protein